MVNEKKGAMESPDSLQRKVAAIHRLGIRLVSPTTWSSGGGSRSRVINVGSIDTVEAETPITPEVSHLTSVTLEPEVTLPDGTADVPSGTDTTRVDG
jgi:hypothetical protein